MGTGRKGVEGEDQSRVFDVWGRGGGLVWGERSHGGVKVSGRTAAL